MGYRSFFLPSDSPADAISISIIISRPVQSRNSITRVGNSGGLEFSEPHDPHARKGFQECVSDHHAPEEYIGSDYLDFSWMSRRLPYLLS